MKSFWFGLLSALVPLTRALPAQNAPARAAGGLPRLVLYHQTFHNSDGNPVSVLPLITKQNIALTHLIVCSIHINLGGVIHLNDYPPSDPRFDILWDEARLLADSGVTVMGMVGGAAPGSFDPDTLDGNHTTFEYYYGQLVDMIATYNLQGLDIDVEQSMSQAGITRLVTRLAADFGPGFVITLAPVASALGRSGQPNLSGFSYRRLEKAVGDKIHFYNGQFYNGFGSMADTRTYDELAAGYGATRVVAGQVTTPDNGYQYVPFDVLKETVAKIQSRYGDWGGLTGWEYFNAQPGGLARPWEWAEVMTTILRPGKEVSLRITKETAKKLESSWVRSVVSSGTSDMGASSANIKPDIDYMALVNA